MVLSGSRPAAAALILLLAAVSLYAWQWPVEDGVLSTSFGQLHYGDFSHGVILSGGAEYVYPASDGELVFRFDGSRFSHPLGNFVVLHHEGGFRTVYANLAQLDSGPQQRLLVGSQPLARVGSSGYALGPQTIFQIIDEELDAFVNPLLILPERPDARNPVLDTIVLEYNGERHQAAAQTLIGAEGSVRLLAELYDPSAEAAFLQILAPYEIVVAQDERELRRIVFETVQGREGRLLLGGSYSADELYRSDRLVDLGTIEVSDEPSTVRIRVRDFSGNAVQRSITVQSGHQEM